MFQWRHQGSEGSSGWQDDLAQLSGGQRSLCAVALLVAVSFVPCRLFGGSQLRCASACSGALSGDNDMQTSAHAGLKVPLQVRVDIATWAALANIATWAALAKGNEIPAVFMHMHTQANEGLMQALTASPCMCRQQWVGPAQGCSCSMRWMQHWTKPIRQWWPLSCASCAASGAAASALRSLTAPPFRPTAMPWCRFPGRMRALCSASCALQRKKQSGQMNPGSPVACSCKLL